MIHAQLFGELGAAIGVLLAIAAYAIAAVIVAWMSGAIYFDVCRAKLFAWPVVALWIALVISGFVLWQPVWKPFFVLLVVFAVFLRWWLSLQPSQDRNWNPNFRVLPRFDLEGDTVTAYNVRNTLYRSETDFSPQYETRVYHLSSLQGVDAVITFWGSPWMCHPFLVFDFGDEGRLAISIEVRYRVGQVYSVLRSLYRQQEIMYVVCDERDAILWRTKYTTGQDVYLYRLHAEPEDFRKVFLEYVVSTNKLFEEPHWYNGLTKNCTVSIYRQRTDEIEWDWRWLYNGKIDQMIYDHGRLDRSLPFAGLKRISRVNGIANEAPSDCFGDFIRERLPAYR